MSKVVDNGEVNTALLILDMISDFGFKDGEQLHHNTLRIVDNVAAIRDRAKEAGIPVVYVNDNYGKWNEDFGTYVANIKRDSKQGREILEHLAPKDDDYFILKPQRSGFYATPLSVLLLSMKVTDVIIAGITTDICVLFTAHDAYMRGYRVKVPADCCAAVDETYHEDALNFLSRVVEADTTTQAWLSLTEDAAPEGSGSDFSAYRLHTSERGPREVG